MLVYLIQHIETGRVYVGKCHNTLAWRWKKHLRAVQNGDKTLLANAIRKHGPDVFERFEIAVAANAEHLIRLEKLYILLFQSHDKLYGYNMTFGGDGGVPTEETRTKLKQKAQARIVPQSTLDAMHRAVRGRKWSPARKAARSKAFRGSGNPFFGHKH